MRQGGVRIYEVVAGVLVAAAAAVGFGQWVLSGVVHSRKTVAVPDLKGKSLTAAVDLLAPLNLGLRKEGSEFNAAVAVSAVLRQSPPPGTLVREGKVIRVTLSQGGETVFSPNLVGLPLRNAEMMLRSAQLILGEVSESYSLRLDKGMVTSQEPLSETSVERGSAVRLAVSAGPPPEGMLLMPDFLRKDGDEASAWASNSGVEVSVSTDSQSLFPYGTVLTQTPAPDTVIAPETSVTFVVSGRAAKGGREVRAAKLFHYELSQGSSESMVRVVISDKYGERELFNAMKKPGSKVDLPVQDTGGARVKIYLNGILVEERDL